MRIVFTMMIAMMMAMMIMKVMGLLLLMMIMTMTMMAMMKVMLSTLTMFLLTMKAADHEDFQNQNAGVFGKRHCGVWMVFLKTRTPHNLRRICVIVTPESFFSSGTALPASATSSDLWTRQANSLHIRTEEL